MSRGGRLVERLRVPSSPVHERSPAAVEELTVIR